MVLREMNNFFQAEIQTEQEVNCPAKQENFNKPCSMNLVKFSRDDC